MAEFVEQRARIVDRQQRRLAFGRLSEIADIDDDRPDLAIELALAAKALIQAPERLEARAK